jgi:hypothetical protein
MMKLGSGLLGGSDFFLAGFLFRRFLDQVHFVRDIVLRRLIQRHSELQRGQDRPARRSVRMGVCPAKARQRDLDLHRLRAALRLRRLLAQRAKDEPDEGPGPHRRSDHDCRPRGRPERRLSGGKDERQAAQLHDLVELPVRHCEHDEARRGPGKCRHCEVQRRAAAFLCLVRHLQRALPVSF